MENKEFNKRNILFSPPDITQSEIDEVVDTLKSGWITTGPKTKLFEKKIAEYCNTDRAVCLNSATAALESTLRLLEIGKGDEVIAPAYTYTASVSVVEHVGAKIVLVDCKKDSFEMDYSKIGEYVNENTKAIIGVDLAGKIADYESLFKIANDYKTLFKPNNEIQKAIGRIAIIADGAHSFGASKNGKKSGSIADFTTFSFHAVKNLTTGEGGAVTWKSIEGIDNQDLYKKYMLLSLHGQSKDALAKTKLGSWEYDIKIPGYKCNMTDIMASIGLAQLERYNKILKRRKEIIQKYNNAFEKFDNLIQILDHYTDTSSSSGHLYLTRILNIDENRRNDIIIELAKRGVPTNVHYKPLPMMTAYKNIGFDISDFPNAYDMYKNEITLPLHTLLTDEDIEYIIENVIDVVLGGK